MKRLFLMFILGSLIFAAQRADLFSDGRINLGKDLSFSKNPQKFVKEIKDFITQTADEIEAMFKEAVDNLKELQTSENKS